MVKEVLIQDINQIRIQLKEEAISKEDKSRIRARITDLENEICSCKWGR